MTRDQCSANREVWQLRAEFIRELLDGVWRAHFKDDKTSYSFDTAPIEHIQYPRDLRFQSIVDFQVKLTEKIQGTHKSATTDAHYTTFLKHFGTFSVPTLETKEVSKEDFILEELRSLKAIVANPNRPAPSIPTPKIMRSLCLRQCSEGQKNQIVALLNKSLLKESSTLAKGDAHYHVRISSLTEAEKVAALRLAKTILQGARLLPEL